MRMMLSTNNNNNNRKKKNSVPDRFKFIEPFEVVVLSQSQTPQIIN